MVNDELSDEFSYIILHNNDAGQLLCINFISKSCMTLYSLANMLQSLVSHTTLVGMTLILVSQFFLSFSYSYQSYNFSCKALILVSFFYSFSYSFSYSYYYSRNRIEQYITQETLVGRSVSVDDYALMKYYVIPDCCL